VPFVENLGTGGGSLDAQYGSTAAPNSNAPLLLDPRTSGNFVYMPGSAGNLVGVPHADSLNILGTEGTPFLSLPGVAGNYASTPDASALDITGDIEIVARLSMSDWTPSATQTVLGKWTATGGQRSYMFQVAATGPLSLSLSSDGTSAGASSIASSTPNTIPDGTAAWVRVTYRTSDRRVQFFTAADQATEPSSWTQLGTDRTHPIATTTFSGSAITEVGSIAGGTSNVLGGDIYRAIVRDGIGGTTVFDADFTQQVLGSRGFIESTGKLVTLTGAAAQIVDGTTYGFLPGVAGSYWSTPNAAALQITGDVEFVARVALTDWTAAASQVLYADHSFPGISTSGISFLINTSGRPSMSFGDGTARSATANATPPLVDGTAVWLRYTLDVDDGAGNRVARFFYATDQPSEPTVWTQIGGDVGSVGAVTLTPSTGLRAIGSTPANTLMAAGRMFRAIIRPNLTSGTKVFDADFTRQLQFASSFTEATGKVVTTNGTARIERERNPELVARVALDAWTGSVQTIIGKDDGSTQRSYRLTVDATGNLVASWAPTGLTANLVTAISTSAVSATAGQALWLKATLDVVNGNDRTVSFYTAPDSLTEPTVWTLLGTAVSVAGSTSIFPGTNPVGVGAFAAGVTEPIAGKVYRSIIRNGIGGPAVLDLDFSDMVTSGDETAMLTSGPGSPTIPEALQFLPNLGWGGSGLNARFGSAVGADTNDPLLLTHTGTNYLYNAGGTGVITQNCLTVPDEVALRITGDLDISFRMSADSWIPLNATCFGGKDETTVGRGYALTLSSLGTLVFWWSPLGTDGSATFAQSTVAVPFSAGATRWVRATIDVDNGAGGRTITFYVANDSPTEPTSWSQLGAPVVQAGTTSIFATTQPVSFGFCRSGSLNWSGAMHRMIVKDGIGGTTVLDVNTAALSSGGDTTFAAATGQTVTIIRSTSGRKSVAVVRDVLLFGTDDFLEVPDSDLLDFAAADSFTTMTAFRYWGSSVNNTVLAKKTDTAAAAVGYYQYLTSGTVGFSIADGVNRDFTNNGGSTAGTQTVLAGIRDVATDQIRSIVNGLTTVNTTDPTTSTLANAEVLRIGRLSGAGGFYADMEFSGSAIWRRALTAAEVALVNTHYTTGPTAASTALLRQAAFWVDAGTRQVAQINRSTAGRKTVACADCVWLLGTDDFFEVPDSPLWDFAPGQDYTLLVLHRGWWAQGTDDTLLATSSSTSASTAGWAMANSTGDPWETSGRHGDGSNGVIAVAPRRNIGALTGTFIVRDCVNDTLTAFTGSGSGTPVTDTTTGVIGNTNVMRLGRLASTGTEYLDAEVAAAVVWRRRLTAAERNAVLAYYGV
jgi:hypothetical protein